MLTTYSDRIEWIDYAKTLGIILVYIGHTGVPDEIKSRIYLFHMPLFFMISGFLWNQDKYDAMSFTEFVGKKASSYISPYIKIGLVCLVLWGIMVNSIIFPFSEYWQTLLKYVFGLFVYSRGTVEFMPQCSPIWFLTCLFCAEILFYLVMKTKKPLILIIVCIGFAFLSQQLPKLYWNIDTAVVVVPFLYAGCMLRKYLKIASKWIIALPVTLMGLFFIMSCNYWTDFDGNRYHNVALMYLASFCCSISVMLLVKSLSTWIGYKSWGGQILSFIGNNTLFLMGYNYLINPFANILSFRCQYVKGFVGIAIASILILLLNRYPKIKKLFI